MDDFEEKLREAEKECAEILGMELDEYLDCVKGDNGNMYFDEGEEMEKLLEYMGIKMLLKKIFLMRSKIIFYLLRL